MIMHDLLTISYNAYIINRNKSQWKNPSVTGKKSIFRSFIMHKSFLYFPQKNQRQQRRHSYDVADE